MGRSGGAARPRRRQAPWDGQARGDLVVAGCGSRWCPPNESKLANPTFRFYSSDNPLWRQSSRIPHSSDEHLERIVEDILREAEMIADGRNGFIEADVREIGGRERHW